MAELLVRNGTVIDGTGMPGRLADIRIKGGQIVEVAPALSPQGEREIDAAGAIVAPGFIDCHTHLEGNLFWDPLCDPLVMHGVTAAVIGNCSLGLAPVRPAMRARLLDAFSYIEDIPLDVFQTIVPWSWESFEDYADTLDRRRLGINIAAYVGHSQLREYVIGPDAWSRGSTAEEIVGIAAELDRAMAAGALGVSISFFDRDRGGNKVPSQYAGDDEFEALFAVLGKHGGSLQFVSSVAGKLEDPVRLGRFALRHGVTLLHNTLTHRPHEPHHSEELLTMFSGLQRQGVSVYSMVTPRPFELSINFHESICFSALPAWNALIQTPQQEKLALLKSEDWRARARHDFDTVKDSVVFPVHRLDLVRIVETNDSSTGAWIGRTLQDLVNARGGHPADVLADWLIEDRCNTMLVFAMANYEPAGIASLLASPVTFVGASDAGAHLRMFSGAGDTTILLARHVRDRGDLTLERGVYELTGKQADLLGLGDRGRLVPGKVGDLTIFRLEDLRFEKEEVVHDVPGGKPRFRRENGGYLYTVVNGEIVQDHGRATGARPAGFLRRSTPAGRMSATN